MMQLSFCDQPMWETLRSASGSAGKVIAFYTAEDQVDF